MIEAQRKRVERAVSEMIDDVYKTHLRTMQYNMHACAAKCCQDSRGTLETVQNCIEGCATPLLRAQDYLQQELGHFQGQLQNCVMQCNDDVRVQMPPSPTQGELDRYQYQFERCAVQCVDKHLALIPNMMRTIKSVLEKGDKGCSTCK